MPNYGTDGDVGPLRMSFTSHVSVEPTLIGLCPTDFTYASLVEGVPLIEDPVSRPPAAPG